jgi:ABC-type lipoprotein export system ATPase subunit
MNDLRPQPSSEGIIEVVDVAKTFDGGRVHALDGVSLKVRRGEFVAITGRSGSGKSTLLHLLAALDQPDAGRIVVGGHDLAKVRDLDRYRRHEVGLVFQLHNLLPHLDARRNVEIPMIGTHLTRAERRARADELLDAVELAGKGQRRPPELSGGERQRVAIARALANRPALLLADEPTGSLDSTSVERVLGLFQRLRNEQGLTIVMVTHDHDVAATADRIVTIRDGRVVSDDRTGFVAA